MKDRINFMKISIDNETRQIYFENDVYEIGVSLLSFIHLDFDEDNSEHPYIHFFQTNKKTLDELQAQYGETILIYLYLDPLKSELYSNEKKFNLLRTIQSPIMRFGRKYADFELPKKNVMVEFQSVEVSKGNWHLLEIYDAPDLSIVCYIEFIKLVQFDLNVRKCQNCRQYFIPKGDYDTRYCDRIPDGKKRTCQQMGAVKLYQEKVSKTPILNEYRKIYRRFHARQRNGTITPEQFKVWATKATSIRDTAMRDGVTVEQFIEKIDGISIKI